MDETEGLTREDIVALASTDDISFHTYKGEALVVAYLRSYSGMQRIFTAREQRLFTDTESVLGGRSRRVVVQYSGYGYGTDAGISWRAAQQGDFSAFASYVDTAVWATITRAMRVGDRLTLVWTADNNNDNHRNVNYHADELKIRLDAADGNPGKVRAFLVRVEVGPDNSARMIRKDGRL